MGASTPGAGELTATVAIYLAAWLTSAHAVYWVVRRSRLADARAYVVGGGVVTAFCVALIAGRALLWSEPPPRLFFVLWGVLAGQTGAMGARRRNEEEARALVAPQREGKA